MGVSIFEFVLAAVVVLFAAATQGTIGLGFNIVAVPVMSLINPLLAPVPQLIMSIPQSAGAFARERRGVDVSGVLWILVGRLPGLAIGVWLLTVATDRLLDVLIGTLVLVAVAILATGVQFRRTPRVELAAGMFAGVSSYVSTIGGPPLALLYSRAEGPTVRSTLGLLFTIGTLLTLTVRIIAGDITRTDWVLGLSLLPAAGLGFLLSSWLKDRTRPNQLRVGIFTVSSIAALALLGRAILG